VTHDIWPNPAFVEVDEVPGQKRPLGAFRGRDTPLNPFDALPQAAPSTTLALDLLLFLSLRRNLSVVQHSYEGRAAEEIAE
jgi:hypothetical protein